MAKPTRPEHKMSIKTENGKQFDVPLKGSLGLLALGAVGLTAWRKKRKAEKAAGKK